MLIVKLARSRKGSAANGAHAPPELRCFTAANKCCQDLHLFSESCKHRAPDATRDSPSKQHRHVEYEAPQLTPAPSSKAGVQFSRAFIAVNVLSGLKIPISQYRLKMASPRCLRTAIETCRPCKVWLWRLLSFSNTMVLYGPRASLPSEIWCSDTVMS